MKLMLSQSFPSAYPHALLAPAVQGFGGVLLLLALCFVGVHIAKFAARGWRIQEKPHALKPPETPSENKTESAKNAPEPIYYIVEKKRRRSKPSYGEPKEIRFK